MAEKKEDKKLQRQVLEKNILNADHEIAMIETLQKQQVSRREMLVRFIDVRQKMHSLAMADYAYVSPTYSFQNNKEYVNAQRDMAQLEFDLEMLRKNEDLEKIDAHLQGFVEQIASHKKNADECREKIAALGE